MLRGRAKYIPLLIFLSGLLLIVFLQFNSGRSVNKLIDGNTSLLNELETRNELQKLETELVNIESRIRGGVITEDKSDLQVIKEDIGKIQERLRNIRESNKDSVTGLLLSGLEKLVSRKLLFSRQVLDTFTNSGKIAAEKIINASSGKELTDSIFDAVDAVDSSRQVALSKIIQLVDDSGRTAQRRGFILAIVACAFCIVAFWYIVRQSMQQQQLIKILDASEKKVKEAARIKEQFLANMSHEIRTPMNAMLGFTGLLQKTELDKVQKQYAENIHSSGEKLLTVVNDILDLSKIEAGMMRIESAPFRLRALVHSVETMFSQKAAEKKLKLLFSVEENVPDILEGDAVRLTQVMINLLGNAIKFTDTGEVKVAVTLIEQVDDKARLRFIVKDTGIGITEDKQQKIFERFQQAESDTTRRYGGTGLGLSIAKQIIDLQNGNIKVQSEPGRGTEFTFELAYTISGKKIKTNNKDTLPEDLSHFTNDITILIAEDNIMNQQLMKHLMSNWRMNYKIVSNGNEAVEVLTKEKFNLVLMDIQMPELDGYHATELIRGKLKLSVPVIAMTAHAMEGEKEKCISYGMSDYISKPIREQELYNLILHHTGRKNEATNNTGIINLDYLREISKGNKNFEEEMVREFIVQAPEEINTLQNAIQTHNLEMIKQVAHALKSSVSFVGLSSKLDPLLHNIETNAAGSGNIQVIAANFEQLRQLCDGAVKEARAMFA